MAASHRHQLILDIARETGRAMVDSLAERLSVTSQTIRRDLNELCDQDLLTRVHGGAILESGVANITYETRQLIASNEKEKIGQLCAEQIPNGASLFINIGTTTEAVARALVKHRDLLVITNNLNIANILATNPHCDIIVTGGMLRRSDCGLVGETTVDMVEQFRTDYAVIGVSAIDDDGSLLDFDYREVRVAQAIIKNARKTLLVADSSKLERTAPVRIAHMSDINHFFTDEITSEKLRGVCKRHGVNVSLTEVGTGTQSVPV